MAALLTKNELTVHLNEFKELLENFNYSSLKNVTFLNLDAVLSYMNNIKGNPFETQYQALQQKLDILQPYLPFVSAQRANEFIEALSSSQNDDEATQVKVAFTQKLRDDFIKFSRTVTTSSQWENVIYTCEEIRLRKEEMLLAHH